MKRSLKSTALVLATLLLPNNAFAQTQIAGHVKSLQHWPGISGILVKLSEPMSDPDSCGRTDWYIMPDASPHAQFVQAMLLSAQASNRQLLLTLDGCLQGLPQIFAAEN